jgi:hypothetical protein
VYAARKFEFMPHRRSRASIHLPAGFALLALAAGAAQGQTHPDGFFLNTPLTLSEGYDSGFAVGSRAVDDDVTLITGPTLAWVTSTHRTDFSIDYQPEIELFAIHPGFDAWNHQATLRFSHRFNSRWSTDVGDYFLSTMDPTRKLENSLVLLPRGRFNQNTFFADMVYRLNGTTKLTFRLDDALTIMDLPQVLGRLDNLTVAGTVTADKTFSSRHALTGTYSFIHVTPLSPATSGSASNVNLIILGYTFTVNPGLLIRLTGGQVEGSSESAFNGSADIEKRLGGVWIGGGYQRYLGFFGGFTPVGGIAVGPTTGFTPVGNVASGQPGFASGVTPGSVYQVLAVRASGQATRRISLKAEAQKALSGTDAAGNGIRSLILEGHISYKLNERLAFFAQVDHYAQNINPFFGEPLSRNRYFGGIEITLLRPQEEDRGRYRHGKAPQDSRPLPPVDDEKAKPDDLGNTNNGNNTDEK